MPMMDLSHHTILGWFLAGQHLVENISEEVMGAHFFISLSSRYGKNIVFSRLKFCGLNDASLGVLLPAYYDSKL